MKALLSVSRTLAVSASTVALAVGCGPAEVSLGDAKPAQLVARSFAVTSRPVTVDVALDKDIRDSILDAARARNQTTRLTIRGVVPPGDHSVTGLNVFLNKPEAGQHTSTEDPNFVGAVEFQPTGDVIGPQDFALELNDVITRLGDKLPAGKPLRVTIVAVGGEKAIPADLRIPLKDVTVTVVGRRER